MRIRFKAPPRTKQPPLLIFILVLIFPPRIPASEGSANCSLVCARSPHWYYTYFALHVLARTNIRTFSRFSALFHPEMGYIFFSRAVLLLLLVVPLLSATSAGRRRPTTMMGSFFLFGAEEQKKIIRRQRRRRARRGYFFTNYAPSRRLLAYCSCDAALFHGPRALHVTSEHDAFYQRHDRKLSPTCWALQNPPKTHNFAQVDNFQPRSIIFFFLSLCSHTLARSLSLLHSLTPT